MLEWDALHEGQKSVSVAHDLRMPQFELQKITTNNCHEENHMGKMKPKKRFANFCKNFLQPLCEMKLN